MSQILPCSLPFLIFHTVSTAQSNKRKTSPRKKASGKTGKKDSNASLSPEEKIDLYRMMVRIRRFEERSLKAYTQEGKIGGFLHLYIGQESVAVGSISLMEENDQDLYQWVSGARIAPERHAALIAEIARHARDRLAGSRDVRTI